MFRTSEGRLFFFVYSLLTNRALLRICYRRSPSPIAIPEAQLTTWAGRGAVVGSTESYNSVKTALEAANSRVALRAPEIYLQGSYRNATNIYGDSDVDIVAEYQGTFHSDVSALDVTARQRQQNAYPNARYTWEQFRADVLQTLRDYYTQARVEQADKCIKVRFGPGRIAADVVPAVQYKKYSYFFSDGVEGKKEGIFFRNRAGDAITNFPKDHIANGEAKNAANRTNGWYKPMVRIFKNARNRLVRDNLLAENSCPSYCVECLIHNATDDCFGTSFQDAYSKIVNYLWTLPFGQFVSQNGIIPLFGTSPVQWNTQAATNFLIALRNLWNNWH